MRNFITKYRKIISVFGAILAAAIITVTTIGVVNSVTAGVFKGSDDKKKIEKGEGNEIVILEIVSVYGQQVIGYTIPGYEPITLEAIESYPVDGPADLSSTDFTDATGWKVKKTDDGYVVNKNDSPLYDTFSENVFGDALDTTTDVRVIVKQANEVKKEDIINCDLIYVNNPSNNHKNLLYYYDQVMNYNHETQEYSDEYEPGRKGPHYDTVNYEYVLAKELAIKLIKSATGRVTAYDLEDVIDTYYEKEGIVNTKSIFEVAGMNNYRECNNDDYLEELAKREKNSIENEEDIYNLIETCNYLIQEEAIREIKGTAGNAQFVADMAVPEKRDEFKQVLIQANLTDSATGSSVYVEENFDEYVDRITSITDVDGFSLGRTSITQLIMSVNRAEKELALQTIINDTSILVEDKKLVITPEVLAKYDKDKDCYVSYNYDLYIEALVADTVTSDLEIYELLLGINEKVVEEARLLIAENAGKDTATADITADVLMKAELEGYNEDLAAKYVEELKKLEEGSLVTEQDLTPVYEELEEGQIEVHFRASEEITGVALSGRLILFTEDDDIASTEITSTEMILEENSNNYYRAIITIPENRTLKDAQLEFLPAGQDTKKTITISADADGSVNDEYWCVFDASNIGKVYKSDEEVVADTAYGEAYLYGDFIKNIVNLEEVLKFVAANNEKYGYLQGQVTYDFETWEVANELYDYVEGAKYVEAEDGSGIQRIESDEDAKGIIFPANILGDIGQLGISGSSVVDKTGGTRDRANNLYKVLLLITARGGSVTDATFIEKVSEEGVYYKEGFDAETKEPIGTGVDEWCVATFKANATLPINHIHKRAYIYNSSTLDFKGTEFNNSPYTVNKTDILSDTGKALIKDVTGSSVNLGDIVRYVMNMYINHLQDYPFRVLEVQPVSMVGELNSYDGAKKLANWLRIDVSDMTSSNWKEYFKVTSISVREFNTQNVSLTGNYDLIYFGINTGTMRRTKYGSNYRTAFNDSSLTGYVYTSTGDKFGLSSTSSHRRVAGTIPTDYAKYSNLNLSNSDYSLGDTVYNVSRDYGIWKKYFAPVFKGEKGGDGKVIDADSGYYLIKKGVSINLRTVANDITMKKFDELMDYLKAGYPILMVDEVINCDDTSKYIAYDKNNNNSKKWRYLDPESKLYNFVKEAKKLGYDNSTKEYTGLDEKGKEVFEDEYTYPSLVNVKYARHGINPENLPANKKFEGGLSFATKRNHKVNFKYVSGPVEYDSVVNSDGTGVTIEYGTNEYKVYKIVLEAPEGTDMEWLERNYDFQMAVDKSGIGRFAEDNTVLLEPYVDFNYETRQVIIEGNWPSGDGSMIGGFVPWRVEAFQKNNPNNHYEYTGFSSFQIADENGNTVDAYGNPIKKDIEVLWVYFPDPNPNDSDDTYFSLDFAKAVQENPMPGYKLNVTKVTYKKFSNGGYWQKNDNNITYNSTNTKLKVGVFNTSVTGERANKEFDMIVFGFHDGHTGLDIDNINALRNISYFVSSGHSVLFSHDDIDYTSSVNHYEYKGSNNIDRNNKLNGGWGYQTTAYATAYMRTLFGSDVYGIAFGIDKAVDPNSGYYSQSAYDARKYMKVPDPSNTSAVREYQEKLRGLTEGAVTVISSAESIYRKNDGKSSDTIYCGYGATEIKLVNEGQISTYPFVLNKEIKNGKVVDKNTINVAATHYQILGLNLENEDTQVWYTLTSSNKDDIYGTTSGDGSNQYYIYTKGNITYTGAGHTKIDKDKNYKTPEIRLFINTVVAAIKAGNYAPEITFPDSESNDDGESLLYTYDTDRSITINFKVSDFDYALGAKDVFSKVNIFFDKVGDGDDGVGDEPKPVFGDGDYRLNADGETTETEYMKNPADMSESINWNEKNIENRVEHSYALSYVDMANLYYKLTEDETADRYVELEDGSITRVADGEIVSFSEITNAVKKLFTEYRLVVQATDIPKNTIGASIPGQPAGNDTNNSTKPEGITTTVVARMSFRELFNLN